MATQVDDQPIVRHVLLDWPTGAGGRGWHFTTNPSVTEELQDAAVVIEDLSTGRRGRHLGRVYRRGRSRPPGYVVLSERTTTPEAVTSGDRGSGTSTWPPPPPQRGSGAEHGGRPRGSSACAGRRSRPRRRPGRPIVGRARFRTVVTSTGGGEGRIHLDGKEISIDQRGPFSAVIDVGKEPTRHNDSGGRHLVSGTWRWARTRSRSISMRSRFGFRSGVDRQLSLRRVRVVVDLSVPPAERLARLEFDRNMELAATTTSPPWQAEIAAADGPGDFVRVLAVLASGESLEDAHSSCARGHQ